MAVSITEQNRVDVSNLYVALFGRAPDGEGLGYWSAEVAGGMSLAAVADQMFAVPEATAYYPSFSTNAEIISSFYLNVLGRTADAEGAAYWLGKLNAEGATPGSVIAEMVAVVVAWTPSGLPADAETDAAGLLSQTLFNNKAEVALYYGLTNGDVAGAEVALEGVTADPATVTAAEAVIDGGLGGPGETFTLTTGVDHIVGTSGNDTILGSNDVNGTGDITFNIGDVVDGGAGVDTLIVANDSDSLTLNARTVTNVENFTVLNGDDSFDTLNLANKTFDTVTVDYAGTNQYDNLSIDGIRADTDLVVQNVQAGGYYVERNGDGVFSTLEGSVSQSNTFMDIDYSVNDEYIYAYNYAYFSAATELNLTNTLDNLITGGTTSTGSDEWFEFYDYIEMEADNATINLTYNFTDALQPDSYNEIYAEVTNGASADVADVVNAVVNADNVDDLYIEIYTANTGVSSESDTFTLNVAAGGLLDTDTENYIYINDFETVNLNINGDTTLEDIDAYSNVTAAQTINVVANANLVMGTFDEADDQAVTVNISGAGDVTIEFNGDNYGETVNAATATGNLDLVVGSTATYATVVTSGSGDDTITLDNVFELNTATDAFLQVIDGGDGTDTFEITAAHLVTSQALLGSTADAPDDFSNAIVNFERLSLLSVSTQDIDATTLGFNDVTIDGYTTTGSLTVDTGASVEVTGNGTTDYAVIVTDAATGTDDSLSLTVNGADGITLAGLTVTDVESISLASSATAPDDLAPGANVVALLADETVTLTVTGATELDLTGSSFAALETVDAAGFDAGLTIDVSSSAEAVTITTGAGADVVVGSDQADSISVGNGGNTVTGGLGLDTITLGSGATAADVDTVIYAAVAESQGTAVDVITGFQVGVQATTDTNADDIVDATDIINDVLDFSGVVFTGVASYVGEANGYGAVLTSLTGGAAHAVLDSSTSILYIDVNGDGALTTADMAISLTGVTDLSAANFAFV